jgi:hypothetical protein
LWAQQNLDRERALFRKGDAGRAAEARAFELGIADEALAAEQARISAGLRACPSSTRRALVPSTGDRVRDTIRIRAQGDPIRMAGVAHVALADWWLRRAAASGDARFCDQARVAFEDGAHQQPASDVLSQLGVATVMRDAASPGASLAESQPLVDLSLYASGWTDSLTARSPLPQYLAALYGGELVAAANPRQVLAGRTPEAVVDELAPAYPEWEPDALYAALSAP